MIINNKEKDHLKFNVLVSNIFQIFCSELFFLEEVKVTEKLSSPPSPFGQLNYIMYLSTVIEIYGFLQGLFVWHQSPAHTINTPTDRVLKSKKKKKSSKFHIIMCQNEF